MLRGMLGIRSCMCGSLFAYETVHNTIYVAGTKKNARTQDHCYITF